MRKSLKLAAAAAGALAVALGFAGLPATADDAADTPTSVVEDHRYPGAARILAEQNVKLLTGDGNILFVDCDTPVTGDIGFIEVYTTEIDVNAGNALCFRVNGTKGLLNMEIPAVFEIRGDGQKEGTGHDITATIRSDGEAARVVPVDPDGSTQVGITEDPPRPPATLLQLKVTG
ncbi:hypothetical protein AMIS_29850 [Actinoplanes missouriensis 431]|uniref:Secreted protein n=1 Tax=Actinoplanes missouriensis (strain ATCC 14538 / DSM 43046 / CBS 188.64 / JCM 3121 / NBRC 102363 / NCIMB 12654 / NRRL B-3342 / UNCC 431) TaxID=512565 RepID=I0H5B8_ACTM4|nr:hypothetical protein [Actinoplanes missouriensis]BAL88205.1 hypothetical protein AMIS_29850 [Actinoplanes missouriensis 431]